MYGRRGARRRRAVDDPHAPCCRRRDAASAQRYEIPTSVPVAFETAAGTTTTAFAPERSGTIELAPGQFTRIRLRGRVPEHMVGAATLTAPDLAATQLVVHVDAAASGAAPESDDAARQHTRSTALIDKPPPLALSVYEPVYFLVGGDDGLNAKFQISLRYRLFDDRGRLARRLRWIDDLYLSFSQTALWDLSELSKPFTDVSYRPRLYFANYDLTSYLGGRLRLGFEAGAGHESNGKEGADSRSFNMAYLRPTLTFGDPEGLRAYLAPLIHNYIGDEENPDLHHYRGYVDWLFGVGSKGGLDFWATLRKGTRSDFGSLEVAASYPLSKLSGGDLTGWLMLQYFNGYGESLLDYNRKLDSQLRLGIAIAL
jgi:phospholipase A1/A2